MRGSAGASPRRDPTVAVLRPPGGRPCGHADPVHHVYHGIGMSTLEVPGVFTGNTTELRPPLTVAYEPPVVIEELGTGAVEDTLLITETGYERLTRYPVVTWV